MKFATGSGMLGLAALAVLASPFAQAQDAEWYLGGNVGQAKAKIDDPGVIRGLGGVGFTGVTMDDKNSDTGYKVFLGYAFNRYFAFEGGYFNLGQFGYTATTVPPGTLAGNIKLQGFNLDAVLHLPLSRRWSLFGRAGGNFAQTKDTFTGSGLVLVSDPSPSKSAVNYKFGGGLQFDFSRRVGLRAEMERYRIWDAIGNKGDIDLATLGLVVRFGRDRKPAVVQASPEPAALPPPPPVVKAPVLVIVPAPPAMQEYCSILDLQFDIDRDEILGEDKEKLAVVGTFLTKYPATTAVIEGHSDSVGTDEHNLELSQRRAERVVDYLVTDLHISRNRLSAVGYGKLHPLYDNSTEEGKRKNRRIDAVIACVSDVEGLTVVPARMTMALLMDFERNKAEIKPEYEDQLLKVARFLKANPAVSATVEGHASNLSSPALAMEVSGLRAQKVVEFLVEKGGIQRSRLSTRAYGEERRYAYNTSAEGQMENRRVNIIINYPK